LIYGKNFILHGSKLFTMKKIFIILHEIVMNNISVGTHKKEQRHNWKCKYCTL